MMKLRWLGHACFRVECGGYSIVIDPFAPGSVPGCRDVHETANRVLCTHQHHDHNYAQGVAIVETDGEPIRVTALESFHDGEQGRLRGPNTMYLLEGGGVRAAHLGDIGCMPDPCQLKRLQGLDAVMVPVGGHYTVGPREAQNILEAIRPRVVIPMHYRSERFGFDVIGPVEDFLELCGPWNRYEGDSIAIEPGMEAHTAVLAYS